MGTKYNNMITTTSGFHYPGPQPLDDRAVVKTYDDLQSLVDSNATYDGLEVYVEDDKKSYKLIDGTWMSMTTENYVNIATGVKKNYLLNPYFVINQRGTTELTSTTRTSTNRWMADRWQIYADDMTSEFLVKRLDNNNISIDNSKGTNRIIFRQMLDKALYGPLFGKDATLAARLSIDGGTTFQVYTATINITEFKGEGTGFDYINVPIPGTQGSGDNNGTTLRIYSPASASTIAFDLYVRPGNNPIIVEWMSLCEGKDALVPIVADYDLELLKCQRFYQPIKQYRVPASFIGASVFDFTIPLLVEMRGFPNPVYLDETKITFAEWFTAAAVKDYTWQNNFTLNRFTYSRQMLMLTIDKKNHGVTTNVICTIGNNALAAESELV